MATTTAQNEVVGDSVETPVFDTPLPMHTSSESTSSSHQQQQEQQHIELVTYMCGGNKFEVPKRYEVKALIGQGAYGVVWWVQS